MLGKNSTLNNSFDIVKNPRSRKLRVPAFTMPAMSDAASSPNDPVFPSDSADDEPARGPRGIQSVEVGGQLLKALARTDRKSTRLNSSHLVISYAVFCLKKKNTTPDGAHVVAVPSADIHDISHRIDNTTLD